MEYHVDVTQPALEDLRTIYEFVHADETQNAEDWFIGLREAIFSLERLPSRGHLLEDGSRLRKILYGNKPHVYQIIYRINVRAKSVSVIHIRHGARNVMLPA